MKALTDISELESWTERDVRRAQKPRRRLSEWFQRDQRDSLIGGEVLGSESMIQYLDVKARNPISHREAVGACDFTSLWKGLQIKWELCDLKKQGVVADAQLETIFNGLVKTWKAGTAGCSITPRRYAHASYQAILVLGPDVVPFILQELKDRPDWWFEALKVLTKSDPTKPTDNFSDAVKAWLQWGKEKNYPLK